MWPRRGVLVPEATEIGPGGLLWRVQLQNSSSFVFLWRKNDEKTRLFPMLNLKNPGVDLERLRQALEQQRIQLLEASRSSPYRPATDLASAEMSRVGEGAERTPILAEILDFSGDGMRIAISPSPSVRVGETYLLRFQPQSGSGFHLTGEVRWVETSPYILVFDIRLLAADATPT
jgi:hypothetical protein